MKIFHEWGRGNKQEKQLIFCAYKLKWIQFCSVDRRVKKAFNLLFLFERERNFIRKIQTCNSVYYLGYTLDGQKVDLQLDNVKAQTLDDQLVYVLEGMKEKLLEVLQEQWREYLTVKMLKMKEKIIVILIHKLLRRIFFFYFSNNIFFCKLMRKSFFHTK